jgi:hypothetical protein
MNFIADQEFLLIHVYGEWCNEIQLIVTNQFTETKFISLLKLPGYFTDIKHAWSVIIAQLYVSIQYHEVIYPFTKHIQDNIRGHMWPIDQIFHGPGSDNLFSWNSVCSQLPELPSIYE